MGSIIIPGASKNSVVAECLRDMPGLEAHRVVGNILWAVGKTDAGVGFIACFKLIAERGYGYGYKAMDEGAGPYYHTCPLKFLELQPVAVNANSVAWRERVKAHHANAARQRTAAKNLTVGSVVTLPAGSKPERVIITQVKPLRGRAFIDNGTQYGCTYRLTPRHVVAVASPAEVFA